MGLAPFALYLYTAVSDTRLRGDGLRVRRCLVGFRHAVSVCRLVTGLWATRGGAGNTKQHHRVGSLSLCPVFSDDGEK